MAANRRASGRRSTIRVVAFLGVVGALGPTGVVVMREGANAQEAGP